MKKFLLVLLVSSAAFGQSVPNGTITQGQVWTPGQWNAAWQNKVDVTTAMQRFVATQGQTIFNLASSPAVFVSMDGVLFIPGVDYTVAGTTLTLTNGALAGQVLTVR